MTVKNKPATPLPWRPSAEGVVGQRSLLPVAPEVKFRDDRDYIAHSGNAYALLVEELKQLRSLVYTYQEGTAANLLHMPRFQQSASLLRHLGEEP